MVNSFRLLYSITSEIKKSLRGVMVYGFNLSSSSTAFTADVGLVGLTLKAPNKNCSRRYFSFYFYLAKKCLAEDFETFSLIFSEKQ